MKKGIKNLLSYFVSASMVSMLIPSLAYAEAQSKPQNNLGQKVTLVDSSYQNSQVNFKFPEDGATSRKYARYRRVFKAYKGRGTIIAQNHGTTNAEIYVNGYRVSIDKVLASTLGTSQIDIGKYTQDGDNTLEVVNITPANTYLNVKVLYPELVYGKPENAGISSDKLTKVDDLINKDISNGFPGAALTVIKDGQIVKNTAYGSVKLWDGNNKVESPQKMTLDTMFDMASNTKMFATNFALQQLVSQGKIKVTDLVSKYLDNFQDGPNDQFKGKATLTLEDLMHHEAGFTPDPQYFNPVVAGDLYSQDKATTVQLLSKTPLTYVPRSKTVYSDVDYMILGAIVEKVTGVPLDQYVESNIYKPLGLTNTVFNPLLKGFTADQIAATERNGNTRDGSVTFPNIRTSVIQGQVHDEKAFYSMGGVSGHAGLFSTTHDMAVLAQLVLNGGGYGGYELCDRNTLDKFIAPSDDNGARGLGWDREGDRNLIWEFGPYSSDQTVGHTGWTGTVTCIDPEKDMAIVLLTNERNSPCPNGVFEAANAPFETGRYGSVMSLVEEALLEKTPTKIAPAEKTVTTVTSNNASQSDAITFPDNSTTRIFATDRRVFKGYQGRGALAVENNGATSADIYVNGQHVSLSDVLKNANGTSTIDIGKYTVDGENALKVLNVLPTGSSVNVSTEYPVLVDGKPEDVGVASTKFNLVDNFINAEVKQGFPGAALAIIKDGKIIKNTAYGTKMEWNKNTLVQNPEKMTTNTMFDLASNTKMFATNMALQQLASDGKIKTTDLVSKYLDNFQDGANDQFKGKAIITLADLMHHEAGFPADPQYFNPTVAGDLYSQDKATTIQMLSKTPLSYTTGTKTLYSDVDYMILGAIVEKVTGMPLDQYVESNIYKPLGLTQTIFNPLLKGFTADQTAATERNGNTRDGSVTFPNIRTNVIQGQVHDEKAFYSMGGVSGHAGLFSTTHDMAVLAQLVLNGGGYGTFKLFDQETLDQFIKPSDDNELYGLGWDRNADNEVSWEFGAYASNATIGHTGWTGTVTCIDPKSDTAIILLTNERNTPTPNGVFDTNAFETGRYGSIMTMVQEALLNKGDDKGAGLIQAAKDQMVIAESAKTVLTAREGQATIDILPAGAQKDQLSFSLYTLQTTVDPTTALTKATTLVQQAEKSRNKKDIENANKYINILLAGNEKDALIKRINAMPKISKGGRLLQQVYCSASCYIKRNNFR